VRKSSGTRLGMDAFERFLFLRTVRELAPLADDVVRVLAAHTAQEEFSSGASLHREGEPTESVHYLVRGSVELRTNDEKVATLSSGDVAGSVGALTGDRRHHSCVAKEETVTLRIESRDLRDIVEDHFSLLRNTLERAASKAQSALRQLGPRAGFSTPDSPLQCPDRKLDLVERMAFLREDSVLRDAHIEAISDLATEVREVRLQSGDSLWDIGDSSDHFLLIVCGQVTCRAREPDQRFDRGPTDTVGSLESLSAADRWFRARVSDDVIALQVDVDVFYDILEDHFEMAMALLRQLAKPMQRLYEMRAQRSAG